MLRVVKQLISDNFGQETRRNYRPCLGTIPDFWGFQITIQTLALFAS